ncbi:hypothetical protein GCM10009801_08600 [Streptomyces albiaxialis]|uniref:Regulatory protein n=1 Tax=Streptomyces albiaxialis TaxID=329523 RepID=A0ABN2VJR3_9ACTN
MAKPFARVDVSASTFMVATMPVPKIRNMETGEAATDRATGETLHTVQLVETLEERVQVIKVTVPANGLPEGLAQGAMVKPVALIASPWANSFGDQINSGLSYRAEGIKVAK